MQEQFTGDNTTSFMDTRQWIALLEKEGELRRITAEVDWDREIGAMTRRVLEKKGPALLFENIKGYGTAAAASCSSAGLARDRAWRLRLGFRATSPIANSSST